MERFYANINGSNILFSEDGFGTESKWFFYHKISNVRHLDSPVPRFVFDYEDQTMSLPHDPKDYNNLVNFFFRSNINNNPQINTPIVTQSNVQTKKKGGCLKVFLIVLGVVAALFVGLIILGIAGSGNQYNLSEDSEKMSADDYKAACQEIPYDELARYADKYKGTKVKLTGQVNQVVFESEQGNTESQYKVAVTKDEYDFYDDDILLYYQRGDNKKLLDEDIITIYGEASGTESYTTVLGESVTVPVITAVYVDIQK